MCVDTDMFHVTEAGVRLSIVDPGDAPRTCVVLLGHMAWLEPFELQRFELLAAELRSRLVVVESAGLGESAPLSWAERRALLAGHYRPVASRLLNAVGEVVPAGESLDLIGYSMGATMASAIAAVDPARFTSLTLVEPVGFRAWNPIQLIAAVYHESKSTPEYLVETAGHGASIPAPWQHNPLAPSPRRNLLDQSLLGGGLSWGRTHADLHAIVGHDTAPSVLLIHGDNSRLSPAAAVQSLGQSLAATGAHVNTVEVPGGHGLWHSLPRVQGLAREITTHWGLLPV